MGKNWSWSTELIDLSSEAKTEASLYNHPDIGCGFSNGKKCLDCPFPECWEIIGKKKFRKDNKEVLVGSQSVV